MKLMKLAQPFVRPNTATTLGLAVASLFALEYAAEVAPRGKRTSPMEQLAFFGLYATFVHGVLAPQATKRRPYRLLNPALAGTAAFVRGIYWFDMNNGHPRQLDF